MTTRFSLALLPCLFLFMTAKAQPVFDFNVEPLLGDNMKYLSVSNETLTDPGPAGPNQTWVLPGEPTWQSNITVDFVAPSSTPFASNYPGATLCAKSLIAGSPTGFAYYSQTDSSMLYHGLSFLGNIVYKNTPAWEQVYPMHYDAVQSGHFTGTKKVGTQITYLRTQFQSHYDGYGTLSFGGGQPFANAIRVKTLVSRIDSLPAANGSHTRTLVNEEFYKWYVGGVRGYVAFISQVDAIQMTIAANGDTLQFQAFPSQFSSEWQKNVTVVSTQELNTDVQQDLFTILGNPTNDCLMILPQQPVTQSVEVLIAGLDGKVLLQQKISGSEERIELPVASFPAGIYLVSFRLGNSVQSKKWVKQ
jgi:hypothetical protein